MGTVLRTRHNREKGPSNRCSPADTQRAGSRRPDSLGFNSQPLARTCIAVLERQPWKSGVQKLSPSRAAPPRVLGSGHVGAQGDRNGEHSLPSLGEDSWEKGDTRSNHPPLTLALSVGCPHPFSQGTLASWSCSERSLLSSLPPPHQPYALSLYW